MTAFKLTIKGGTTETRTLHLKEGVHFVGSSAECGISATSAGLAPRHTCLWLSKGRMQAEDLQTETQSTANGHPLVGRMEVRYPVSLKIGELSLQIVESPGEGTDEKAAEPCDKTELLRAAQGSLPPLKVQELPDVTVRVKWGPSTPEPIVETIHRAQRLEELEAATPSLEKEDEGTQKTVSFEMHPAPIHRGATVPLKTEYLLDGELARGGMGRIYRATDPLLNCQVAVKVSSDRSQKAVTQFEHEARVLADLAHPNIVPVHAMGISADGFPFYSMKLVRGRTLQRVIRKLKEHDPEVCQRYTLDRLLSLFKKVCNAVEFAHSKGYLHRDLKPDNIMVGQFGEVLVMDWGIAQRFGSEESDRKPQERALQIEGTPRYMSPEQALGGRLDERSDVYALGGVLYSILMLQAPVQGTSVKSVLDKVIRGDIEALTTKRSASPLVKDIPRLTARGIPDALRAVTTKAMARQPEHRYANVAELISDIEAYQNGFATNAEKANLLRIAVLLFKRHREVAALLGLLLLSAIVFTLRLAESEKQARISEQLANEKALEAQENARLAASNAQRADLNANEARKNAQIALENAGNALKEKELARKETARAQIALAEAAEQGLNADQMQRALKSVHKDHQRQEWQYLMNRLDSAALHLEAKGASPWKACIPHPQKPNAIITLQYDGWIRSIDLGSGATEDILQVKSQRLQQALGVSNDGQKFAIARGVDSAPEKPTAVAQIEIHSTANPEPFLTEPFVIPNNDSNTNLKFSKNDKLLLRASVSGYPEAGSSMIDAETGKTLWSRTDDRVHVAGFSHDSKSVNIYSSARGLLRLDPWTGEVLEVSLTKTQLPMESGPDHNLPDKVWNALFSVQKDICRKLDLKTGSLAFELRLNTKLTNGLPKISHIPSENTIVTLSSKNEKTAALQFWNEHTGTLIRSIPVFMEPTLGRDWNLTVHPASGEVVIMRGTQMKIWRSVRGQLGNPIKVPSQSNDALDFVDSPTRILKKTTRPSQTPETLQTSSEILEIKSNQQLKVCELDYLTRWARHFQTVTPNGRELAAWAPFATGTAFKFFELQPDGKCVERLAARTKGRVDMLKISPSNRLLWTGSEVYDTKTGSLHSALQRDNIREPSSGYSGNWVGDSKLLAIAMIADAKDPAAKKSGANRFIVLWDANTGKILNSVEAPNANALSVSPDGRYFAEASRDLRVRIHNTTDLVPEKSLRVHESPVISVAWHPKLPLLATSSEDCTVKIWDLDSEQLVGQYGTFYSVPNRVSWSPDGAGLGVHFDQESYIYTPKCAERAPTERASK